MAFGKRKRKFGPRTQRERKSVQLVRERKRLAEEQRLIDEQDTHFEALQQPNAPPAAEEEPILPAKRTTHAVVNYAEESTDDDEGGDNDDEVIDPKENCESLFQNDFEAVKSRINIRIAIAIHFEVVLGSPPQAEWRQRKTVNTICKVFGQTNKKSFQKTVRKILSDVVHCQENSIRYTGEGDCKGNSGRKCIIQLGSAEAGIISDAIKNGRTIKDTKYIVNQYREANNLPSVTYHAVYACFGKLKPSNSDLTTNVETRVVEGIEL